MIGAAVAGLAARRNELPSWTWVVVSMPAAFVVGWLVVNHRNLAFLPALLVAAIPLLVNARARVVYIIFGGLLIFQSSSQLDSKKMLFLMGASLAFGAALFSSRKLVSTPAYADLRPLFGFSLTFFALVLISFPVAKYYGTSNKDWLRDVSPYVLVACAPLFALDAQASMSTRALRRLFAIAGTVGTIAFAAQWLTNRGIANLKSVAIGLPTFLLGGAVFAYGIAIVLGGRRGRLRWLVLSGLIFALFLSTGTR
jgi:hypothetical protein